MFRADTFQAASAAGATQGSGGTSRSAAAAPALHAAADLLRTNPAFQNAGLTLKYVLDHVKPDAQLSQHDKGAVQHAIQQMQRLVHARAVNPAQADVLNAAIHHLQGALVG
jgi:hypothetical protein